MTEDEAVLALNAVPGIGGARLRKLVRYFGSAPRVFKAGREALEELGEIPDSAVDQICSFDHARFLKDEQSLLARHGVRVVYYREDSYPSLLKEIADAPPVLYYRGDLGATAGQAVGIVGTRKASLYGLDVAEKFAVRLAEFGIVVVSGMARGIDTAAHRGALKARGLTVAVLGCGLAHVYPPENAGLARQISGQGCVLSEFSMDTPPIPKNFPRRNRIISGLSLGVVVVEAALRSGALITSDYALQQGREVFAVPGRVDAPMARGVNQLIQQGAKLAGCVEDILEELAVHLKSPLETAPSEAQPVFSLVLSEEEGQVLAQIDAREPRHIDEVAALCPLPFAELASVLFSLELKKAVRQLPGKYFVRQK